MLDQPLCFCGGPFQTNGYLLRLGTSTVLFDAPLDICRWLQAQNAAPDVLILTHQHHDHIMDVARIVEAFECPVWAHSPPSEDLSLQSSLEAVTGQKWEIGTFVVERFLDGSELLKFGDIELPILHVPGHSPDSLCFEIPGPGFLIGGDVLFRGGIGRTDFPNGDHQLLLDSIRERLWPLADETIVFPGHGPPTTIGTEKASNPYL